MARSTPTRCTSGGSWGAYFYNGHVYSSEIYRGLDVFDLTPTENLTQNEIDAAKLVHFDQLNPQSQPKIVWPAGFPVVRAYLDQLIRDKGLTVKQTDALTKKIDAAEKLSGAKQRAALTSVAAQLTSEAATAKDKKRVRRWLRRRGIWRRFPGSAGKPSS